MKNFYKLDDVLNMTFYNFNYSKRLNGRKAAILLRLVKKQVNSYYKYQYGVTSRWREDYNENKLLHIS